MKISQSFAVDQPRQVVWAMFQDIPALAECMPGAVLTEDRGDGIYIGKVAIKLGPFKAAFEGEAKHSPDAEAFRGHVEGKGIDKRGGSRSRLIMDYALNDDGGRTEVAVDADVQLSGPIAQFGRAGIIEETANLLIGQFVENIENKLVAASPGGAAEDAGSVASEPSVSPPAENTLNGMALLRLLIGRYFKKLFGAGR